MHLSPVYNSDKQITRVKYVTIVYSDKKFGNGKLRDIIVIQCS